VSVAAAVHIHMLLAFNQMYRTARMFEATDQQELPDLIFWAGVDHRAG